LKNPEGSPLKTFAELDLIDALQRSLVELNYLTPTPIQSQTIPQALDGRDILGCAQTGTGKTAAFALPILNYIAEEEIHARRNSPIALVLAPTRELAIQIGESFDDYGRHLKLRTALVFGGVGQGNQVRDMNRGPHILVATPGRLLDLMDQGFVKLNDLEIFVLDEADRMLDMGFMPALKKIIAKLPEDRQSMFFSATMPPDIVELSDRLLYQPVQINVTPKSSSVKNIQQQVIMVEKAGKQALLQTILSDSEVVRAIVFTRTKRGANLVSEKLQKKGIASAAIHGNKSQGARQRALEAFKSNDVRILVATELAARGIDVDGVSHVINFDLPNEPESYVHRIGRTGRAGANGMAISFCSSGERSELRAIEDLIGKQIPLAPNHPHAQADEPVQPKRASGADKADHKSRSKFPPRPQRKSSPKASRSSQGTPVAAARVGSSSNYRGKAQKRNPLA
jgi:ATP-dependent RNA helicase RhlE